MIYAPVVIITLCRFEELKRCVESLKRNIDVSKTDLYIGVDFPLKDSHRKGYNQIIEYLEAGIEGFANVYIVKQQENKGWFENFISVRDKAYEKYDRFIYLEDDVEVSQNFLEYMNKNLDFFEKDVDVQAICGYSYPFEWEEDKCNIVKINTYYTAWGYATWKDKEEEMYRAITMQNFNRIMRRIIKMRQFYKASNNQFANFVKGMLEYIPVLVKDNEIVKLDMAFSVYIFMYGKYVIFPKASKTRNIGCDGKGMNCEKIQIDSNKPITSRNYDYSQQPIDLSDSFNLINVNELLFREENNLKLNNFYPVEKKERFKTILAYAVYLILGRNLTKKLL